MILSLKVPEIIKFLLNFHKQINLENIFLIFKINRISISKYSSPNLNSFDIKGYLNVQ